YIFREHAQLDRADAAAEASRAQGVRSQRLSSHEAVILEPALAPIADRLVGALHHCDDEVGDAFRFCVALANCVKSDGVEFLYGRRISALEVRGNRVAAAASGHQRFFADRYVVAAGSWSSPLLRTAGIDLPVYPAKGYSLTFAESKVDSVI